MAGVRVALLAVQSLTQPWSLPDPMLIHHLENKGKFALPINARRVPGLAPG
jgi:hypothetical protein